jgi:hypothetical protein
MSHWFAKGHPLQNVENKSNVAKPVKKEKNFVKFYFSLKTQNNI